MKITSVMYHYVRPVDQTSLRYLSLEDFEKQLIYLEQRIGPIITRNQWEDAKLGREVNGVLLTFDDGLKDHYKHVLPVLLKYNYFAIFFICTDPIVKKSNLPVHLIHHLLSLDKSDYILEYLKANISKNIFSNLTQEPALSAYSGKKGSRTEILVKKLINYCHGKSELNPIINNVWDKFSNILLKDFNDVWYMNRYELTDLLNKNMVIGSHTCSHTLLTSLNEKEIYLELSESKKILEDLLPERINEFCYPFGGAKSYNKRILDLIQEIGYQFAHDVAPRVITTRDIVSRFTLPRFDCNSFPNGIAHTLK